MNKTMKQWSDKTMKRGVTLYLALMVMTILLAIALGITTIIVNQMKMFRGMGDSVIAFHAADSGVEYALNLDDPVDTCDPFCWANLENGAQYSVSAVEGGDPDYPDCPSSAEVCISSVGTYKETRRAIQVALGALPFCSPGYKKVFVTSQTYTGNLGGLAGADAICESLAEAAGLADPADPAQNYMAWLSDGTDAVDDDVGRELNESGFNYCTVDGKKKIADNWYDLTDGALQNPINIDENKNPVPPSSYDTWTNTSPEGTITYCDPDMDSCSCQDWTDDGTAPGDIAGNLGCSSDTDAWWTDRMLEWCDNTYRLYCFEQ